MDPHARYPTASVHRTSDPEKLGLFSFLVFSKLEGAVTAGMIHLGDRLGLYRALATSESPLTTAGLAEATGLDERWVREWAYNQGAAQIIDVDGDELLSLSSEAADVLTSPDHPSFAMGLFRQLPQTMAALDAMPEAFRSGVGLDYDSHGPEGIEGGFEPWNRANLLSTVVPALDGVAEKLTQGGLAVDIGCGAGGMALVLAAAFPASEVRGYDISQLALARARDRQAEEGIANLEFLDPRASPLPANGSADLITTFDCLHDMTDPVGMVGAIHAALATDGTWLLVDIKAHDTYAENARRNPMASLMYGTSVLSCMSSALSEEGGAGLGTLGLSATKAERMATDAGFTRFRQLDIDHPVNAFYEIRH